MVAAHRGVATGAAENTIAAFTNAIDAGADMVEFDVRRTRDGELIAFHDAAVRGRPVGEMTRDEIEAATGVRPPLLHRGATGLRRADPAGRGAEGGRVRPGGAWRCCAAASTPEQLIVTSFLPAVVAQVKRAMPEANTGLLVGSDRAWIDLLGRLA